MPLDIPAVQRALVSEGLDGWLLYDFRHCNPIAVKLAGLTGAHTTRRWLYFIPATGTPIKVVHAIESFWLDHLPGRVVPYADRQSLDRAITDLLDGVRTIGMEYSPNNAIPSLSRVDAGTVESIRARGVHVVSSGNLVALFESVWDAAKLATHRAAAAALYRIKDRAFAHVGAQLMAGRPIHEFEVQQLMLRWFDEEGLESDAPPAVAAQEHAGNPHYSLTAASSREIRRDELLLLDLWGKLRAPDSVYADITWVGFAGSAPAEIVQAFETIVAGRDAAVALVTSRIEAGHAVMGWEVDRAARDIIASRGYGAQFIHRTGHSLGEEVHGNGVNIDDYETHDDRRLLPGTAFTIEPGIYTPAFGVRTEINMVIAQGTAEVTGPRQSDLVRIG